MNIRTRELQHELAHMRFLISTVQRWYEKVSVNVACTSRPMYQFYWTTAGKKKHSWLSGRNYCKRVSKVHLIEHKTLQLKPNSITLAGSKLVRAEIWPII